MRDRWTDAAAVQAQFGVPPGRSVDVLALMGDSIDNIPGVKRHRREDGRGAGRRAFGDLERVLEPHRCGRAAVAARRQERSPSDCATEARQRAPEPRAGERAPRRARLTVRRSRICASRLPDVEHAARRSSPSWASRRLLRQLGREAPPARRRGARWSRRGARPRQHFAGAARPAVGWRWRRCADGPARRRRRRASWSLSTAEARRRVRVPLSDAPTCCAADARRSATADRGRSAHDLEARPAALCAAASSCAAAALFDVMIAAALVDPAAAATLEALAGELLGERVAGVSRRPRGASRTGVDACSQPLAAAAARAH